MNGEGRMAMSLRVVQTLSCPHCRKVGLISQTWGAATKRKTKLQRCELMLLLHEEDIMENRDMQGISTSMAKSNQVELPCKQQGRNQELWASAHCMVDMLSKPLPLLMVHKPGRLHREASGKPRLGNKATGARWLAEAPSVHRHTEGAKLQEPEAARTHDKLQLQLDRAAMDRPETRDLVIIDGTDM